MRPSLWIAPLLCALAISCGAISSDNDDDDDDATFDAAAGSDDGGDVDASGTPDATPRADAPPLRTVCGDETCDRATQICVFRAGPGPATRPSCERLPDGCEADRSCECVGATLCTDLADVCVDLDEDNTILCDCPFCA